MKRRCGLQQDRNQKPVTCSQVWKEDTPPRRSCGDLQQSFVIQLEKTGLDNHNMQILDYVYVEKVLKNLRHKLSRSENDEMSDLKTNVLTWELFMSTTMKSAIHLCLECDKNLIACQNHNFEVPCRNIDETR